MKKLFLAVSLFLGMSACNRLAFANDLDIFRPEVVKAAIAQSVRAQADHLNAESLARFMQSAKDWKQNATRSRELGIALPEKPKPPVSFVVVVGADGWPTWATGEPVAAPVPDLESLPVIPAGARPGEQIGNTRFYRALPGDDAPDGYVFTGPPRLVKRVNPWGGVYERVD